MKCGMATQVAGCLKGDIVPFPGALPSRAASFLAGEALPLPPQQHLSFEAAFRSAFLDF